MVDENLPLLNFLAFVYQIGIIKSYLIMFNAGTQITWNNLTFDFLDLLDTLQNHLKSSEFNLGKQQCACCCLRRIIDAARKQVFSIAVLAAGQHFLLHGVDLAGNSRHLLVKVVTWFNMIFHFLRWIREFLLKIWWISMKIITKTGSAARNSSVEQLLTTDLTSVTRPAAEGFKLCAKWKHGNCGGE